MLHKVRPAFAQIVSDEVRTARYLFLIVALGFSLFALWGDNSPIIGPLKHEWITLFEASTAFVLYILLSYVKASHKYYQKFGYLLIYTLNLGNVYLLYGTGFELKLLIDSHANFQLIDVREA